MRILTVFGTRPEAIKMAPLVLALQREADVEHKLAVTAQHRGLLDDVLTVFGLTPDFDLDLMRERQSLEYITSGALTGVAEVLAQWRPDFLLVHGDTTTTFAAALAAFYAGVPVGHVEAGLRTASVLRPFPEELNRRLTDLIAAQCYCPTEGAAEHLRACADVGARIFVTGNTALDAVRIIRGAAVPGCGGTGGPACPVLTGTAACPTYIDPQLARYAAHLGPRLLVTAHRRESWGAPLESICRGLLGALTDFPDALACFCWHPNPEVRETVLRVLMGQAAVPVQDAMVGRAAVPVSTGQAGPPVPPSATSRILLVDPPRFDVFVNLMADSDLVLSDSGGIQEEVSWLKRYVLVLREETERPEAVAAGFARLVGTGADAIRAAVAEVLPRCLPPERGGDVSASRLPPAAPSPFGDGHAADKIVVALLGRSG